MIGLVPRRRGRLAVIVLGGLFGLSMAAGSVLSGAPVVAVAAIGILGVAFARLAATSRIGYVAMILCLPMIGVGLSYEGLDTAVGLALLMLAGSAYACAVSMLWPEREAAPRAAPPPPGPGYGLRLGAAGATAAAIGFLLGLDHVGWACAAALLVMRPEAEMQRLRSLGRVVAVAVGALAAIALVRADPAAAVYSAGIVVALAGASATNRSRWYVTAAFTTFLVFLLLLYSEPGDAAARFGERMLETVLGVVLAYVFGLALPRLTARRREPAEKPG